ncbi:kinase-like domain-containing protein [Cenococcum geophilum]
MDSSEEIISLPSGHTVYDQKSDIPFTHLAVLGQGSFGFVEKVEHPSGIYARKQFRLPKYNSQRFIRDIESEVNIISKLRHRHIVQVLATYHYKWEFGIIMRPVADMNLEEFLAEVNQRKEQQRTQRCRPIKRWFRCLTEAIAYMHSKKMKHKDLKPSNILVLDEEVLIADFGIAKDMVDETTTASIGTPSHHGTPLYQAPEVEANNEPRGRAADIFSLGCVFLEMFTVWCMQAANSLDTLTELRKGQEYSSYGSNAEIIVCWIVHLWREAPKLNGQGRGTGSNAGGLLLAVIAAMLDMCPEERPTAEELVKLFYNAGPCCSRQAANDLRPWTPFSSSFQIAPLKALAKKLDGNANFQSATDWPIIRDSWLRRKYLAGRWRPREERRLPGTDYDQGSFWMSALCEHSDLSLSSPEDSLQNDSGLLSYRKGHRMWVLGQREDGWFDAYSSVLGVRGWIWSKNFVRANN